MATVEQILTMARRELGYKESPANSNRTKFGKWYGLDGNPWCMMFVMWVFYMAAAPELLPVRTASCGEFMRAAKKVKNWRKSSDLKPGDIVIFDFPGNSAKTDHVGIVEELGDGDWVITIEGNTSMGNDANGGMVMRRKRARSLILGAYRPEYDAEQGAVDDAPQAAEEPEPESLWQTTPENAWHGESSSDSALYDEAESASYDEPEKDSALHDEAEAASESGLSVGDAVSFTGYSQFSTPYDDAEAVPATPCAARLDACCPGTAHPFQLYGEGIQNWANLEDVKAAPVAETPSLGGAAFRAEIAARPSLRVRSGPGVAYDYLHSLSTGTVVTIVEERNGWGKLSGDGWVSMKYVRKLS